MSVDDSAHTLTDSDFVCLIPFSLCLVPVLVWLVAFSIGLEQMSTWVIGIVRQQQDCTTQGSSLRVCCTVIKCCLSHIVSDLHMNLYTSNRGTFDIYVKCDGVGRCVGNYDNRGSFGELALMYNTPRAATITATSPGALWGLVSKILAWPKWYYFWKLSRQ